MKEGYKESTGLLHSPIQNQKVSWHLSSILTPYLPIFLPYR